MRLLIIILIPIAILTYVANKDRILNIPPPPSSPKVPASSRWKLPKDNDKN